jgi:hypothetical protein
VPLPGSVSAYGLAKKSYGLEPQSARSARWTAAREMAPFLDGLFSLSGKVAVVTGATVVLGGAMVRAI